MKDVETSVSKKYVLLLLMLALIVDATLLLVSLKQYYLIFDTSGWNSFIVFNIVVLTLMLLISKKDYMASYCHIILFINRLSDCFFIYGMGIRLCGFT